MDVEPGDGGSGREHGRPAAGIEVQRPAEHRRVSGGRRGKELQHARAGAEVEQYACLPFAVGAFGCCCRPSFGRRFWLF